MNVETFGLIPRHYRGRPYRGRGRGGRGRGYGRGHRGRRGQGESRAWVDYEFDFEAAGLRQGYTGRKNGGIIYFLTLSDKLIFCNYQVDIINHILYYICIF